MDGVKWVEGAAEKAPAGPAGTADAIAFRAIATLVKLAVVIDELDAEARDACQAGRAPVNAESSSEDVASLQFLLVRTKTALQNAAGFSKARMLADYLDPRWAEAVTESVNRIEAAATGQFSASLPAGFLRGQGAAAVRDEVAQRVGATRGKQAVEAAFGIGGGGQVRKAVAP